MCMSVYECVRCAHVLCAWWWENWKVWVSAKLSGGSDA